MLFKSLYNIKGLIFFIATAIFITGCFKKEKFNKIVIDPANVGWGIPIIDSRLTLGEILGSIDTIQGLKEEEDHSYTFTYNDVVTSALAPDLIALQDFEFSKNLNLGFPISDSFNGNLDDSASFTENIIFDSKLNIQNITFKKGAFAVEIQSTYNHPLIVRLNIPGLKNSNNEQYNQTFFLDPANNIRSLQIDLRGYNLDISGETGDIENALFYRIFYQINGNGLPLKLDDQLKIKGSFKSLNFKDITGDFSRLELDSAISNTDIRVFESTLIGDVSFKTATITVKATNGFGFPIEMGINQMRTEATKSNRIVYVRASTNNFKVDSTNGKEKGKGKMDINPSFNNDPRTTTAVLNDGNSNVEALLNPAPDNLAYILSPKIKQSTKRNNYITDESVLKIEVEVKIPIYGILRYYLTGDTLGVDEFPERSDENYVIDSVQFNIQTENFLPMETSVQLYFLDFNGKKIDSLISNPSELLARPDVSSDGKVLEAVTRKTSVRMSGNRYDEIMSRTNNLYLMTNLRTSKQINSEQTNVRVFSTNYLQIKISALASGQARVKMD